MRQNKPEKPTVIITSIGSRVGQGLLGSLLPLRPHLNLIGLNSQALAPALFSCDQAFLMPPTAQSEAYLQRLSEIVAQTAAKLVIPARDQELPLLSQLAASQRFANAEFFAPPHALLPVFTDKYQSSCFARLHQLPFAQTASTAEELENLLKSCHLPFIAKPRWGGHASKNVYLVQTQLQAQAVLASGQFVLQELLQADSLKIPAWQPEFGLPWISTINDYKQVAEMVLGKKGELVSLACSQTEGNELNNPLWQPLIHEGTFRVAQQYAEAFASAGYQGPLNLQGKCLKDGQFVVYELNGRFTGSAAARTAMGYNQVKQALQHFLWGAGPFAFYQPPTPTCAIKMPQTYLSIMSSDLQQLQQSGSWQAPPK